MEANTTAALDVRLKEYSRYTEIKQLAYNVALLQQKKMFQTLAVLSFYPGEGKTLVCAALALAYAETCRSRTLVVDTTLRQSHGSLLLQKCFSESPSNVDFISVADRRSQQASNVLLETVEGRNELNGPPSNLPAIMDGDFSIVKSVASENRKQYGLILLDTVPLGAKNKSNFDPMLIARMADASTLVVSRRLLDAANLNERLKLLEDPSFHLLGVISNEDFDA